MMAIQSGEVDAWVATPSEIGQMNLEANNLTTYAYSEGRVGYMAINVKQIPGYVLLAAGVALVVTG